MHHGLRGFLCFLCISVSRASAIPNLMRSLKYHPDLSSFRYMAGVSPSLRVFHMHGLALLAVGPVSACGLAITLSIVVYCNTTIKMESVWCTLKACGIKYVRLLAETFGIASVATQPSDWSLSAVR